MDSWLTHYNRQNSSTEQLLNVFYSHWQACVNVESPSEVRKRFQDIFIEGLNYQEPKIWWILEQIVNSDFAEKEFKFILNRCCYILINHWQKYSRLQGEIPKLVELFEATPIHLPSSRTTQRLRQLVQGFAKTEQYLGLRRLAQVLSQKNLHPVSPQEEQPTQPLGKLIPRYPYLYEHCLLTKDSTDEVRQNIRNLRDKKQQQFELDLSKYVCYQQLPKNSRSLKNPTLLDEQQLEIALKHFTGKVDGANTYRDLAKRFQTYSSRTRCYRTFKEELYEHLIASIDPKYANAQFNQRLYQYLQNTLPQHNAQEFNETLLLRTCRKLLDFLVIESAQQPNHSVFVDLTGNLGITPTIGLLLQVTLLCDKVRFYLEQKFALLFKHYESCTQDAVGWLLESLENLNIAFSLHFGKMKLG